jgi:hypothetical protein
MSLAGRIFAILNIAAATGFLLMAWFAWAQRERWSYEVYRHDLLVEGLPIDAKEDDRDGTPRVDRLSDKTLAAIEPSGTGTPVKTQQDEVKRVKTEIETKKIASNDVPGTKSQKLAQYLRPLARTGRERDDLTQKMTTPPPPDKEEALAAELQKQFDKEFEGVNETGADGKHSPQQRKDSAARLLLCLGEALHEGEDDYFTTPAYKRYVNVVGLTGAARAADEQAGIVQVMTQEAILNHEAELKQFVEDLDARVYRTQTIADAVERQEKLLKLKEAEVAKAKQLVETRTAQLTALREQLAGLQAKTGKSLADQAKAEQEIMDRLIELRDTAQKNQELEREIRRLEGLK